MGEIEVIVTTLPELERAINRLASRIAAPQRLLPTYERPRGDATPCVQLDDHGFHYVISERGVEYERITSRDPTEILYQVFDSITFSMASDYEVAHRIRTQDFRRLLLQRQEELLGRLSDSRAERSHTEHAKAHFDDSLTLRGDFAESLKAEGMPAAQAWQQAEERYPRSEADA